MAGIRPFPPSIPIPAERKMSLRSPIPLFVTADDFAMDPGIDAGILEGIAAGGITNVSIWVDSAPYAFTAEQRHLLARTGVGLHWGAFPLEVDINRPADWHWIRHLLAPTASEVTAAEHAWDRAAKSLAEQGLPPTFINGHQHVHLFPGWVTPISRWAARRGMRVMRRPLEVGLPLSGLAKRRPAMAVLSSLGWFASRRGRRFPGRWVPAVCRWGHDFVWEEALSELGGFAGTASPIERQCGVEVVLHPGRPTVEYRKRTGIPGDHEGQLAQLVRPDLKDLLSESPFALARFSTS